MRWTDQTDFDMGLAAKHLQMKLVLGPSLTADEITNGIVGWAPGVKQDDYKIEMLD